MVRSEVNFIFGSGEGGYFPIFKHDYTVNGVGGGGVSIRISKKKVGGGGGPQISVTPRPHTILNGTALN